MPASILDMISYDDSKYKGKCRVCGREIVEINVPIYQHYMENHEFELVVLEGARTKPDVYTGS